MNPALRNLVFTLNNPTDDEQQRLERLFADDGVFNYAVFQREIGENGTEHLQGYCELARQTRFNRIRELLGGRAHIERRRGTARQASEYCKKDDTRVAGPFEFGTLSDQGKRNDLVATFQRIEEGATFDDLIAEHDGNAIKYSKGISLAIAGREKRERSNKYRHLDVSLLWGLQGAGKTRFVYDKHGLEAVYTLTTSSNTNVWFDGYEGQDILLIDDYRGFIPFQLLLKILDIYPLQLQVKGSFTYANWTKVYITSNHPIEEWYRADSGHHLPALRRRIHRILYYHHSWQHAVSGDVVSIHHGGEPFEGGERMGSDEDGPPIENAELSELISDVI